MFGGIQFRGSGCPEGGGEHILRHFNSPQAHELERSAGKGMIMKITKFYQHPLKAAQQVPAVGKVTGVVALVCMSDQIMILSIPT